MSKQKIVVFGTGGTIAGKAASMSDNVGYKAGEVAIGELLANIPGMQAALQGHELVAQQVAQIDAQSPKRVADRPVYAVLDNTKLKRTLGLAELTSWQESLQELVQS